MSRRVSRRLRFKCCAPVGTGTSMFSHGHVSTASELNISYIICLAPQLKIPHKSLQCHWYEHPVTKILERKSCPFIKWFSSVLLHAWATISYSSKLKVKEILYHLSFWRAVADIKNTVNLSLVPLDYIFNTAYFQEKVNC